MLLVTWPNKVILKLSFTSFLLQSHHYPAVTVGSVGVTVATSVLTSSFLLISVSMLIKYKTPIYFSILLSHFFNTAFVTLVLTSILFISSLLLFC